MADWLDAIDILARCGITTGAQFEQARVDAAMAVHGHWKDGKCACGTPFPSSDAWYKHRDARLAAVEAQERGASTSGGQS